jgi:hypothetical protein
VFPYWKTIGTIGTAGIIGTGFSMEGRDPQVKRKILSDIPDDSTGFEAL